MSYLGALFLLHFLREKNSSGFLSKGQEDNKFYVYTMGKTTRKKEHNHLRPRKKKRTYTLKLERLRAINVCINDKLIDRG